MIYQISMSNVLQFLNMRGSVKSVNIWKIKNTSFLCSSSNYVFSRRNIRSKPKITFSSNKFLYSHYSYTLNTNLKGFIIDSPQQLSSITNARLFNTTSFYYDKEGNKPSSQIEATVNDLKEKAAKPNAATVESTPKKSIAVRIKDEILHYYHGFKLLFIDVKISSKYFYSLLNGDSLSRREYRQLIRTTGDLFRLVPFSVFIIVPFMEFLLPVALKLFPGMLPSTFETTNEKEAKIKKKLKVKLEMAKFLQQTLDSMAVESKGHHSESAKEFVEFFAKTHRTGEVISNEDIMKFSKLFEDELTLDSLSRPQLTALCRLLEMQPFGTNNFLRFQLRMKLRQLIADDKIIHREGIDSLAVWELQQACRTRGMRAFGMSKERLQMQLSQWLDLSLNEKVPPSLLLLSRTLFVPVDLPPEETLAATISTLPDEVATRTKASISKKEGKLDNVTRLEIIKSEEEKIREDKKEELEEKRRIEMERKKEVEGATEEASPVLDDLPKEIIKEAVMEDKEMLVDKAPIQEDKAEEIVDKEEVLSAEDIDHVEEALEMLEIKKKKHFIEEKELLELKSEMADYEEDIKDFKEALVKSDIRENSMKESKAAQRLYSKVNRMIRQIDPLINVLNKEKELIQKNLQDKAGEQDLEVVNIEELLEHLKHITSAPDASKIEIIKSVLSKMDDDFDGAVKVEHVLKVLKLISEDHVSMSKKLFEDIVETLAKEEKLETETLIELALQIPQKVSENKMPPPPDDPTKELKEEIIQLIAKEKSKSNPIKREK